MSNNLACVFSASLRASDAGQIAQTPCLTEEFSLEHRLTKAAIRRRLLLVAYDFPPINSAGIHRILGMSKYLQRMGWDVTVLTVRNSYVFQTNESLKLVPPGVSVIRTTTIEPSRITYAFKKWLKDIENRDSFHCEKPRRYHRLRISILRTVTKVLRWTEQAIMIPDVKAGWFIFLFRRARRLLRSNQYDAVLSSSPPHSVHLPLLLLRQFIRFRWVVDLRDPWTIPKRHLAIIRFFRLQRRMECWVLRKCDHIVANTAGNREALSKELGEQIMGKTTVITNGFDKEYMKEPPGHAEQPDCDIVYTGEIYPGMLDVYIGALKLIHKRDSGRVPRLRVFGPDPHDVILEAIQSANLEPFFDFRGFVPYEHVVEIVRDATALLLLLPHGEGLETWVPSKVYTYLFATGPILFIGPRGDAANVVEETDRGLAVTTTNLEEVATQVLRFMDLLHSGRVRKSVLQDRLAKFSMDQLAMKMDSVLRNPG